MKFKFAHIDKKNVTKLCAVLDATKVEYYIEKPVYAGAGVEHTTITLPTLRKYEFIAYIKAVKGSYLMWQTVNYEAAFTGIPNKNIKLSSKQTTLCNSVLHLMTASKD